MKDIVCACSSSFIKDTPIVDINNIEESQAGVEVRMLADTFSKHNWTCTPLGSEFDTFFYVSRRIQSRLQDLGEILDGSCVLRRDYETFWRNLVLATFFWYLHPFASARHSTCHSQ